MSYNLYHNLPDLARKGGFMLCDGETDEQDGSFDWRFIASIDTARLVNESDFVRLDNCITFLIRSSVGNLLNVLDPAIAKVYVLSKLCLQYLLFCTKVLDKSVYSLRENIFECQKKTVKLEEIVEKRNDEIEHLQKKLKRQEALNQSVHPCTKCNKNFLTAVLLENHILRRHPVIHESKDKDSNLINTIKLELEIKQLKERLNTTEKELMDASKKVECLQCQLIAQRRFKSVGVQSNFEEKEKDDIEKDAIAELLTNQMKNFEELKQIEETRNRSEIMDLRAKLDETIAILKTQKEITPPSPAPRAVRNTEITVCESTLPETSSELKPTEENLWKIRYEELEKLHEERIASKVSCLEKSYKDHISNIEARMNALELEKLKISEQRHEENSKLQAKLPLSPKVVRKVAVDESFSSDSSSENIQSLPKNLPTVDKPVESNQPKSVDLPTAKKTFSAQKFLIRAKTSKQAAPQKTDKRGKAKNIFYERLKSFGISQNQKELSKSEFNNIQSKLVDSRAEVKKKSKSFFKVRRQVLSNLDKAYQLQETNKSAIKAPKETVTKTVGASHDSKIPSIKKNVQTKGEVLRKVEVVSGVSPSKKAAFRDSLEKTLATRLPSSLSNARDILPSTVKRKEKKVEFDLNNDYKIREIREEDGSDFDISSFTSDIEENKNFK